MQPEICVHGSAPYWQEIHERNTMTSLALATTAAHVDVDDGSRNKNNE